MLVTGAFSARFGAKCTVVTGLALIVVATLACALAGSISQLVALRTVWGLGNAFFIANALSMIVGAASGVSRVGSCCTRRRWASVCRPGRCWAHCSGTSPGAVRSPEPPLMIIGLVLAAGFLPSDYPSRQQRQPIGMLDPLRALRHGGLLQTSCGFALYTAGFFTVLAWSPLVLEYGAIAVD